MEALHFPILAWYTNKTYKGEKIMLAHTLYTYSFDELDEAAKHKAWEREYYNFSEDYSSEYRATLEKFEYLFDILVLFLLFLP